MFDLTEAVIAKSSFTPIAWAAASALVAAGLWLAVRWRPPLALLLRFLARIVVAWGVVCLAYFVARPTTTFHNYLLTSTSSTIALAAAGTAWYLIGLFTFRPGDRQWRRSADLLAGVTLMSSAFVRAAYQPAAVLHVQVPMAVLFIATIWRFRAEPLVYLSILALAATVILGARNLFVCGQETPAMDCVVSTAAGVSLLMVFFAAILAFRRQQEFNVKWYRQGFLIVPVVVSSLAAMVAGYLAVWDGASWHTVWALGVWWAVLLVSAIGLKQPDLFGFSSVGAGLASMAAFAVLGGDRLGGYWGRYPSVLLAIALGAAVLAAFLTIFLRRSAASAFPRALYLAGAATAVAAILIEPLAAAPTFRGTDLLLAAAVLALAHAHRAPAWVNYLVAALVTCALTALVHLGADIHTALWHHHFIQATAATAVAWLALALALRTLLRWTASDRTARRQAEPLTVFGMAATLLLAATLSIQQIRTYAQFFINHTSPTLVLLGPFWGLVGWLAVLLAFLLSMWLVRHTARTFLFYVFGIMTTAYLGLFYHTDDLYNYLIYAVAGYGSAHLLVYLYEAKFMGLLWRTCALYRDERRASTTIFTLAVISCFCGAVLAFFRLSSTASFIMLGLMAVVFLVWSFVWLRGEMLYPAVLMATLWILSVWHNKAPPTEWNALRVALNAAITTFSALLWLGIGNRVHAVRGEIFQLAGPARACSVILALVGTAFAAILALSPTFATAVWREPRTLGQWALGLATFLALILYFTWAAAIFHRRFYSLMSRLSVLLLGLYVGLYVGLYLGARL